MMQKAISYQLSVISGGHAFFLKANSLKLKAILWP